MADLLHALTTTAAQGQPDAVAVVDGERTITYAALDERAGRVAAVLADNGVQPGDRVAIHLMKSIEAVTAVYGAMRAGAIYVPIDPKSPAPRAALIAGDCHVAAIVVDDTTAKNVAGIAAEGVDVGATLQLGDSGVVADWSGRVATRAEVDATAPAPLANRADDDPAYILYTSGSTGRPKGVTLTHRNALHFVDWAIAAVGVDGDDRLSSHAPFHFDLSVFDLYAASRVGAPVALVPGTASMFPVQLGDFLEAEGITVWYSVPTILRMLADKGRLSERSGLRLRRVLFAGEVFPTPSLRKLMELLPGVDFWNLYGPTETNVCTAYRVPGPPATDDDIPIGAVIDGVDGLVLDEEGHPVEPGTPGELVIAGPTVSPGYWGDEERTAKSFGPDPRIGWTYRTGDLVADEGGGIYRFLGRRDHQVKSRGYRIELGEVETALHSHPAVVEACVVAVPDALISNRLHAFVVVDGEASGREVTAHVRSRLPAYMVPTVEVIDALPRTSTQKIDRVSLRDRAAAAGT